jgi:hypothetical protein
MIASVRFLELKLISGSRTKKREKERQRGNSVPFPFIKLVCFQIQQHTRLNPALAHSTHSWPMAHSPDVSQVRVASVTQAVCLRCAVVVCDTAPGEVLTCPQVRIDGCLTFSTSQSSQVAASAGMLVHLINTCTTGVFPFFIIRRSRIDSSSTSTVSSAGSLGSSAKIGVKFG